MKKNEEKDTKEDINCPNKDFQDIEQMKAKLEDYTNQLKRLQAEFENYVKRAERERTDTINCAAERIITKLLVINDDLERAIKQIDGEAKKGVQLIAKNLWKLLEDEGVRPIESLGKKLDPFRHEVVLQEKTDKHEENTVIDEIQKGYMLKDKVIRHPKVKIARR